MNLNFKYIYDPFIAKQATLEIMKSRWEADNTQKQKLEDSRQIEASETISQKQGSIRLREKVVKVMETIHPCGGLSLQSLRDCKQYNKNLFSILHQKRVSHALSINGKGILPSDDEFDLNGFNDTFTIPMLASSLFSFATKYPEEQEKALAVGTILTNALFNDRSNDIKIKKGLKDLNLGIPLMIGSGWDWHVSCVTFMKGEKEDEYYVIVCNRGGNCNSGKSIAGWNAYSIKNVDAFLIKDLASRMSHTIYDYISSEKLEKVYRAKFIYQHKMKDQTTCNCSYISVKANISFLMQAFELTSGFKLRLTDEMFTKLQWLKLEDRSYKSFSYEDRHDVLLDYLIGLKESVNAPLSPLVNLVYQKLANNPIMGFKIGWELWLEIIELSEKANPVLNSVDPYIRSLVKEFIEENKKKECSSGQQLVRFILLIIHHGNTAYITDSLRFFDIFTKNKKGLIEVEQVIQKMMTSGFVNSEKTAIKLLCKLVKNGCSIDSLDLAKTTISKRPSLYQFEVFPCLLDAIMVSGRFENTILKWMHDPKSTGMIKKSLETLFDYYNVKHFANRLNEARLLMPYLNEDYINKSAVRGFCLILTQNDCWQEAEDILKTIKGERRDGALFMFSCSLIIKKMWEEAKIKIAEIKNPELQKEVSQILVNAQTYPY